LHCIIVIVDEINYFLDDGIKRNEIHDANQPFGVVSVLQSHENEIDFFFSFNVCFFDNFKYEQLVRAFLLSE
jgi:hypothetical protein